MLRIEWENYITEFDIILRVEMLNCYQRFGMRLSSQLNEYEQVDLFCVRSGLLRKRIAVAVCIDSE